jgi:hypothetical protein
MKFFANVALVFFVLSCGGGSSTPGIPQADACNQASKSACTKLFSCTDTVLVIARTLLGGTEASCETMIQANYCAPFQCMANQTYRPDKALQCKNQFGTVSCSTLAAAAATGNIAAVLASVPGCTEVCSGGDAGTTGG